MGERRMIWVCCSSSSELIEGAATKGSVESLIELLREDPLILDRTIVSCASETTPLHIASVLGHLDFVKELLSRKPELAAELDSQGSCPLHLAAAKGHLEVARRLLLADPEMVGLRNFDGRTPLQVAVIKGRVEVLAELVRSNPDSTRMLTDRDETVLHLAVRHNRLEALKLLVETMRKEAAADADADLVINSKDCDGNSILHIAVTNKQIEIIDYLLTSEVVVVNALNRNGWTALDVLTQSPRDLRDLEIKESLRAARALSAKDLHLITNECVPPNIPQITKHLTSQQSSSKKPAAKHKHPNWLGRKRSALMVVSSLIATVAFQAGLTPPGGVWQDDYEEDSNGNRVRDPHTVGTSVMAYKEPLAYGQFMIFDTIAFLASLSIILLLVSGLPIKRRRWMWIQMVTMWITITAQVLTFFISLRNMSPKDSIAAQGLLRKVTEISVLTWLTLMGVVFIGNVIRMNLWILRKYGYIKEKERQPSAEIDSDPEEV